MYKKAIVIIGPESSGNHLLCSLLNSFSFVTTPGDKEEVHTKKHLEAYLELHKDESFLAIQRSIPCDKRWWNLKEVVEPLEAKGYFISFIIMSREWRAMASSQYHKHTPEDEPKALVNIRCAYEHIFYELSAFIEPIPYMIVNYESLIQNKTETLKSIKGILGVDFNETKIEIHDMNRKWYK